MLDVVYSQIIIAREADEVMLIAFVVAHKDILAMQTSIVTPRAFGFLDCLALRMVVNGERYVMLFQKAHTFILPIGNEMIVANMCRVGIRQAEQLRDRNRLNDG